MRPSRLSLLALSAALAVAGLPARATPPAPLTSGLERDLAAAICRGKGLIRVAAPTEPAEADFDLAEKVGLLQGHLMIGKTLLDAGRQRDALPHFGHPVREIYDYLKPVLAARNLPAFEEQLAALETQAGSGKVAAADYQAALDWAARLRGSIAGERRSSAQFQLRVIAQMIDNVADDYGEAQERGLIVNMVEYHDAMGFLAYTDLLVADLGKDPRAATVRGELDKARAAFPSLEAPRKPTVGVARLHRHAATVLALANTGGAGTGR